jgi:hypothetical protein
MKKGNYTISSILKGSKTIEKILKGTITIYESFIELIASGVPPITLQKCKGVDLVDYKIYGDSVQGLIPFDTSKIVSNLYPASSSFVSGTKWRGYTFEAKPNTTYTLNKIKSETTLMVSSTEYPAVGVAYNVRTSNTQSESVSITTGENDNYVTAYFYRDGTDTVDYGTVLASIKIVEIPTPDNPIEIETVGDKTSNIFNMAENVKSETKNGLTITYSEEEDCIILNGTTTNVDTSYGAKYFNIPNIPGTSYGYGLFYVSGTMDKPSGKYASAYFGQSDNGTSESNWKAMGLPQDTNAIYVATCDKNYIRGFWIWISAGVTFNNYKIRVQLEKSTEKPTSYDAYNKYKIPVRVRGKNYINIEHLGDINNWDTTTTYGSYEISLPNGNYIFNIETDLKEYKSNILFLSKNKSSSTNPIANIISGYGGIIDKQLKFTITNNEKIYLNWYNDTKNQSNLTKLIDDVLNNFIIEDGDTFTGYEPYIEPITTNIYLNEPLRKIGDYTDYIDFEKGKVFRQIGEEIYDENTSFSLPTGTYWHEEGVTTAFTKKIPTDALPNALGIKCLANLVGYQQATTLNKKIPYISGNATQIIFAVKNETASNIDELKTFLTDNNLQIVYPLKEETPEIVTLPNIPTNKGTTIIEVDTSILPSNMEVVYWGKGKLEKLEETENIVLNSILGDDTETEIDITDTEINQILDKIIGG